MDLVNSAKRRFPKNQAYSEIWMETEQEILYDRTMLNRKLGVTELAVLNIKALNPLEAQLRFIVLLWIPSKLWALTYIDSWL